jgi:hypothetical protein
LHIRHHVATAPTDEHVVNRKHRKRGIANSQPFLDLLFGQQKRPFIL